MASDCDVQVRSTVCDASLALAHQLQASQQESAEWQAVATQARTDSEALASSSERVAIHKHQLETLMAQLSGWLLEQCAIVKVASRYLLGAVSLLYVRLTGMRD